MSDIIYVLVLLVLAVICYFILKHFHIFTLTRGHNVISTISEIISLSTLLLIGISVIALIFAVARTFI